MLAQVLTTSPLPTPSSDRPGIKAAVVAAARQASSRSVAGWRSSLASLKPVCIVTQSAYDQTMAFTRIKIDHRIMGGLPCITGTRIPVAMLVRMVASGTPIETILDEYPQLVEEDVREALRFAAANIDQRVVPLDQSA